MRKGSMSFNPPQGLVDTAANDNFQQRAPVSIGPDHKPPKVLVQSASTAATAKTEID